VRFPAGLDRRRCGWDCLHRVGRKAIPVRAQKGPKRPEVSRARLLQRVDSLGGVRCCWRLKRWLFTVASADIPFPQEARSRVDVGTSEEPEYRGRVALGPADDDFQS